MRRIRYEDEDTRRYDRLMDMMAAQRKEMFDHVSDVVEDSTPHNLEEHLEMIRGGLLAVGKERHLRNFYAAINWKKQGMITWINFLEEIHGNGMARSIARHLSDLGAKVRILNHYFENHLQ